MIIVALLNILLDLFNVCMTFIFNADQIIKGIDEEKHMDSKKSSIAPSVGQKQPFLCFSGRCRQSLQ